MNIMPLYQNPTSCGNETNKRAWTIKKIVHFDFLQQWVRTCRVEVTLATFNLHTLSYVG
jgi:pullulanase/glycogen debranching enzyme